MPGSAILWRRLDGRGHDCARLLETLSERRLEGSAVFLEDGLACRLDYTVLVDEAWRTRAGRVRGWAGEAELDFEIEAWADGRWTLDGTEVPAVRGCLDLDLSFSPSTNLLPIRRLELSIGAEATVRSAWLVLPSFELRLLEQLYARTSGAGYRYRVPASGFTAELEVDARGFPTRYAGLFEVETGGGATARR